MAEPMDDLAAWFRQQLDTLTEQSLHLADCQMFRPVPAEVARAIPLLRGGFSCNCPVAEQHMADDALLTTYCAARKRKLLEWRNYSRWIDAQPERPYLLRFLDAPDERAIPGLELAVRIRALAYQHRPGYRGEWRP